VGLQLKKPELLFEKIEDDVIEAQIQKLLDTKKSNELTAWKPDAIKENVSFDEFMKMDIRVGTVLDCQKVPKADKLLQFRIDDGLKGRTILSGIAEYYPNPSDLIGKQVLFIANFPPRKLRGVDSEGMILSAENPDGSLTVVQPGVPLSNGSKVV
jgi:methionyl-tRNA synthetase